MRIVLALTASIRSSEQAAKKNEYVSSMNRLVGFISLCALVACILTLTPSIASAGAIVIGQINPPGLTAGGVTGITFDKGTNPLGATRGVGREPRETCGGYSRAQCSAQS